MSADISRSLYLNPAVIHIDKIDGSAIFSIIIETVVHVEIICIGLCLFSLRIICGENDKVHMEGSCQIIGFLIQLLFFRIGKKIRLVKYELFRFHQGL